MGWRNRPKIKENWPSGVDAIMFIDENGDSSLKNIINKINRGETISNNDKYFTITGCIIRKENFIEARDKINNLKAKYWENGLYEYKGRVKKVCFHSSEIRGEKEAFSSKIIDRNEFITDLSMYMLNLNIEIFSATLDKEILCRKYPKSPENPYNLCMDFIVERFVKFYLKYNEKGAVVLEQRGKKQDKLLLEHLKDIADNGTRFAGADKFKKIKGFYFNPKWCKGENEKKSYFGLEIADLISYPIHKYNITGKKDRAFECIESKIHGYPHYNGKGIKIFPGK